MVWHTTWWTAPHMSCLPKVTAPRYFWHLKVIVKRLTESGCTQLKPTHGSAVPLRSLALLLPNIHSFVRYLGVILYILLCANYPFTDDRNIPTARFNTENPSYKKLSEDAKDILHKIFQVDPRRRATPDQLLRHRWITRNTHTQNNLMTEEYISGIRKWKYSKELKNNLKNRFQSCRKMKEKVIESLNRFSLTHLLR